MAKREMKTHTTTALHDFDAELNVIGACMLNSQRFLPEALCETSAADFNHPAYRTVFEAIAALDAGGHPVDGLTIRDHLKRNGKSEMLNSVGGFDWLSQLPAEVITVSNIGYHAKRVRSKAERRRAHEAARELVAKSLDESTDDGEFQADWERRTLAHATSRQSAIQLSSMAPLLKDLRNEIDRRYEHRDRQDPLEISTGFSNVDGMLGGLRRGDLIIVAARPSMGKTSFALNVIDQASAQNVHALAFSLEMSASSLAERMVSSDGRVNGMQLRTGRLQSDAWKRVDEAMSNLADRPITIAQRRGVKLHELRAAARRWRATTAKNATKCMVVVDYLGLVQAFDRGTKEFNRNLEVAEVSAGLKDLAGELDAPVVVLAQLNRDLERREDKRPQMSDLRDSGAIEQDADVVAFLYRDEVYHSKPKNAGVAELIVGKNRNGPTGTLELRWEAPFSRFSQWGMP